MTATNNYLAATEFSVQDFPGENARVATAIISGLRWTRKGQATADNIVIGSCTQYISRDYHTSLCKRVGNYDDEGVYEPA